jgi:8-oxo-dGTP diphosphatase
MLKVAVGVIKNQYNEVLISKRFKKVHQGGLWEFPGGKVEEGEKTEDALKRELLEELNIEVLTAVPFIQVKHDYNDIGVLLEVYLVESFQGKACGMEGQPIKWLAIDSLDKSSFPAANKAVIDALNLPRYYPIVDESIGAEEEMLSHLKTLISGGYTMIQWRAKSLNKSGFKHLAEQAMALCKRNNVRLFINSSMTDALEMNAEAIHLSANEVLTMKNKASSLKGVLLAASCHNEQELKAAKELGVLFAVLSPVCATQTHIGMKPLGWPQFKSLSEAVPLPVFALGGVGPETLDKALSNGAYGVAGIRAFGR